MTDEVDSARPRTPRNSSRSTAVALLPGHAGPRGLLGPQDAAIIGDEKTVTERLDDLRGAGVDEFVGLPFGRSQEDRARTRALLRTYASATDER